MGGKAIGIIFFIIAIGGIVFLFQSGILSGIKNINISFPKLGGVSSTYKLGGTPVAVPNYVNNPPPASSSIGAPPDGAAPSSTISAPPSVNPSDIPPGFTAGDLSYFFHKVRISAANGYAYAGSPYFTLSDYSGYADPIDVTGWLVKSTRGGQYVPGAINMYDPTGLSAESDISMRNGDTVNFYPSQSPIGKNLRLNKCIGYLGNSATFNPPLPTNCPVPDRSDISSFSGACQDYIASLGACKLPSSNPPIPQYDYACQSYLNTLNYKGCYSKYAGDADFLSHEVRVWIGSVSFLDTRHDKIDLFDRNGKLVDEYIY